MWHIAAGTDQLDEGVAVQLEEVGARAGARTASTVESTALERAARLSPDPRDARARLVAAAAAAWAGGQLTLPGDLALPGGPGPGLAWVVLSVVVVVFVDTRGISGYASGLVLVDAREPDLRRGLRQRGSDPRRLSSAVAVVGAVGYLVVSVVLTVVTLSPMVGGGLAVLLAVGLVVANLVLVGYLAYTGVVVVRREGHGLGNLLTLGALGGVAGLLLLLGLGIVLSWSWLVIPAVAGLAVSATFGLLLTAFVVYGAVYARQAPHPGMDAIVVLGSKVFGDRVPPLLAARIDRGLEILGSEQEAGRRPVLVLSGGQGSDEDAPEGAVMARYALREGADAELVRVEDRSRTTEENLTLSRDLLLGEGLGTSLVVTTNDFHAFRAAIIARELGLDAQVVGAPTARYYFPSAVLREFIAVLARSPIFHAAVAVVVALAAGALAWLVVR